MSYDAHHPMDDRHDSAGTDPDPGSDLVTRAAAGDEYAFGQLYDQWFDRVHHLAEGIVRDRAVAAEVTQDAFLRAWQSLATVREPAAFGGWLLRIARNTALNRRRVEIRTRAVDGEGLTMI